MPKFNCANPDCGREAVSKHSVATYCSRKCSNQANIANLLKSPKKQPVYTDEFLLNHLVELARKLGRTPTRRQLKLPDGWTYEQRFGSFNNAVIAAGLIPNVKLPPSFYRKSRKEVSLRRRFRILRRDGFRCQYCGGTPQEGYILHVDHIVPRSKGGPTTDDNLITACQQCNLGKHNFLL